MTTPATRAGRALARQRHSYIIICEVCGRSVVKVGSRAKRCGSRKCEAAARRLQRQAAMLRKAEGPVPMNTEPSAFIGEAQQ